MVQSRWHRPTVCRVGARRRDGSWCSRTAAATSAKATSAALRATPPAPRPRLRPDHLAMGRHQVNEGVSLRLAGPLCPSYSPPGPGVLPGTSKCTVSFALPCGPHRICSRHPVRACPTPEQSGSLGLRQASPWLLYRTHDKSARNKEDAHQHPIAWTIAAGRGIRASKPGPTGWISSSCSVATSHGHRRRQSWLPRCARL